MDNESEKFPIEIFPEIFRDMAVATSLSCQCGNDIPGIVTLGVVNAAIGPSLVIVNPITGEETPSNLFQIGIADSGTGKSRVMKKLQQPLVDFEKSLTDDWNKNKVVAEAYKQLLDLVVLGCN